MAECIFCRIVRGEIPCHKIAEDEHTLAFLDIGPLSEGHALVIPKRHAVTLDQLDDDAAGACVRMAKRIGAAVSMSVECEGWNLLQNNGSAAGQVVMHVHFHVIPRIAGDALGFRWPAGTLDREAAERLVDAIQTNL